MFQVGAIQCSCRAAVIAGLFAVSSLAASATTTVKDVSAAGEQWLVAQADSQKRVEAIADEGHNLADEYRATLSESDGLRLYIEQLRAQVKSQEQEKAAIRQESAELDRTNIEILPLMQKMLTALEQFVSLDMPFLQADRRERIAKLNEMMPRADVTVSEKYRRIVEAYQLEMEYGRTIEAYRAALNDREVDFLRIGRIALLYQTPDGKETGYWDKDKKIWVRDDGYSDDVREGLKVARKQTSPNLLMAPVHAAKHGA